MNKPTKDYVESPTIVYDVDKEITAFALDVLFEQPKAPETLNIEFEERYLLEVLPQNVYNR